MRSIPWYIFAFFAIGVGIYPVVYLLFDMSEGLLASKPQSLLADLTWSVAFYIHIAFGGLALFIGWIQFSKKFRNRYLNVHRWIGKIYIVSILLSGSSGLYVAMFATGGIVSVLGFAGLATAWLLTTIFAYRAIRRLDVDHHEYWMIRSYALCFAAVTLRIWLPLFQFGFGVNFFTIYPIIAWLCWVPNLLFAEWVIHRKKIALTSSMM